MLYRQTILENQIEIMTALRILLDAIPQGHFGTGANQKRSDTIGKLSERIHATEIQATIIK